MRDFHTSSTCRVPLVMATVLGSDGQLVEFSCNMISGTGVRIPVCVDAVGVSDDVCLLFFILIVLIAIPTLAGTPAVMLEAYLALGIVPVLWSLLLLVLGLNGRRCGRRCLSLCWDPEYLASGTACPPLLSSSGRRGWDMVYGSVGLVGADDVEEHHEHGP